MKKLWYPLLAVLILAGSAFTFIAAADWKIAPGYSIAFSGGGDVGGVFKDFAGTVVFDESNAGAGKFDVTIQVASINTGNGLQNKHVKSDEWLDATKYPTIRYTSQKIAKTAAGYQVTGDLEMHGVKKPVAIPFTFKKTAAGGVFAGTITVNRNDFKIGKPGGDVDDNIKVEISVPVTK